MASSLRSSAASTSRRRCASCHSEWRHGEKSHSKYNAVTLAQGNAVKHAALAALGTTEQPYSLEYSRLYNITALPLTCSTAAIAPMSSRPRVRVRTGTAGPASMKKTNFGRRLTWVGG